MVAKGKGDGGGVGVNIWVKQFSEVGQTKTV